MPVPTVPYQLSFSHLPPTLGSATQEEVMVQHPWLHIGLPGVRVKTDKRGFVYQVRGTSFSKTRDREWLVVGLVVRRVSDLMVCLRRGS